MVVHLNAISPFAVVIICIVALLIFGPKKLPELGRAVGTTLREFKKGAKGLVEDDEDMNKKNVNVIEQQNVDKENK
ncbi:twin-arginine translocase TatA/TatE family subunit [Ureibacillus sp. 179-F W5.1 NHS]|uniref:Sec-independent protein translocase protein TatA n=1 Tax=Lysinibacillus halotolerans TaxID=1368476 RepID=A0A3M8H3A0_9BACI|nr:twin-arginine translocase TatA/TatE family subunit [Lysinibacillus halotolerans]RNC96330.1 twin-arginine translocase TatA/TatE family subunit [Lysinibacillus halotolerans]